MRKKGEKSKRRKRESKGKEGIRKMREGDQ